MSGGFQAPKGTFDVLPEESARRARVEQAARSIFERAGYERIETPAFEDTELFERGVGRSTDIVNKEMFSFEDQGGRRITLRPEGTAPICRAYVEHGMHTLPQPVKLWCMGPFFRHERPQAGRYRQFSQIDAEAIGSDDPLADAELIGMLDELLRGLGVPGVELRLASLGSLDARVRYLERLKAYLHEREADLAKEVRERIDLNPLRAFDSDHEGTRAAMAEAPKLLDHLDDADAAHFEQVRSLLDAAGIAYSLDPTLVRGLDYYTRTIFSFVCDRLGAQSEVGGGGRYDGLVEQLGGHADPGGRLGDGDRAHPARPRRAARAAHPRRFRRGRRSRSARAGDGDPLGAAPGRALRGGRPRRAKPQGTDPPGRPRRCRQDADPRGRRLGAASRHAERRAAPDRGRECGRGAGGGVSDGFPALAPNGYRDTWCGQVLADRVDGEARVAGWVHRRRDHGGLIFIDLRDRTGLVQLVFHPEGAGGAHELAHELRPEDVVTAAGSVVRRSEETINREPLDRRVRDPRRRGARCSPTPRRPPFGVESYGGEAGEETRLRYRYLDLRREPMRDAIALRHGVVDRDPHLLQPRGLL